MELKLLKTKRQSDKGKSAMQEEEAPLNLTSIEKEIEGDRETCHESVNLNLEKLLQRANGYNQIIRHMAYHYRTQNKIWNIRVKQMKARLRRALKRQKEEDRLNILVEASLAYQYAL